MYTNEEMEAILAPLKEIAANEGYNGNLVSFYAQRRFDETLTITLIVFKIFVIKHLQEYGKNCASFI